MRKNDLQYLTEWLLVRSHDSTQQVWKLRCVFSSPISLSHWFSTEFNFTLNLFFCLIICLFWSFYCGKIHITRASLVAQTVKNRQQCGRPGLDPWVRKIPGGGHGNPLQYSCLENPMDRGAWQAKVHGVARVRHDLVTKPPPNTINTNKQKCIKDLYGRLDTPRE